MRKKVIIIAILVAVFSFFAYKLHNKADINDELFALPANTGLNEEDVIWVDVLDEYTREYEDGSRSEVKRVNYIFKSGEKLFVLIHISDYATKKCYSPSGSDNLIIETYKNGVLTKSLTLDPNPKGDNEKE